MLNTVHKRKSAIYTTLIMSLLLVVMFFWGMTYMDPPPEYGIAVNFGTSDFGSGEVDDISDVKSSEEVQEEAVEEVIEEQAVEDIVEEVVQEEVLTQQVDEAPVINEVEEKKEKPKVVEKELEEVKKEEVIEKPKPKPKPSKEAQKALNNLLFGAKNDGKQTKGEGDDTIVGLKGKKDGDPKSANYYGNNGSGGDGNYLLKGRKALSKPKEQPNCNEEGVVVVKIEVDATGKVIRAIPGVKGSTNTAKCLLEPAKKAALSTKWNPDGKAPSRQVGYIRYNFLLSE